MVNLSKQNVCDIQSILTAVSIIESCEIVEMMSMPNMSVDDPRTHRIAKVKDQI